MRILLAGSSAGLTEFEDADAPYVMGSYYYMKPSPTSGSGEDWKLDYRQSPHCKGIMVDSGAFTYIKDKPSEDATNVDWYDYATSYAEWVRDNDIQRWIELDLDGPMGLTFTRELRNHMEDIVGRQCIPVWHRSRGIQAFRDIADTYDLIAMGGFPWNEIGPDEYHHLPSFINEAHKRGAAIHGLGFQPHARLLKKYHFDSTDSTNWIFDSFKTWRRFNGTELEQIRHQKKVTSEMYHHNLREWAKFARYMDGRNQPQDPEIQW